MNISSNSSTSSINHVCNGIGMIEFELTDSIAASAIVSIITNIVLAIVSIIGNGLSVYVIAFRQGFTSFAFRGLFMISVFSIFFSCVTQVLFTVTRFHDLINYHDCQLKLATAVTGFICQCGLYTTTAALAIDRYIAVVHPNYYNAMKVYYIYITQTIITAIVWVPIIITSIVGVLPSTIFKVIVAAYLCINLAVIAFTYIKVLLQLIEHNKNRVQNLEASMKEAEAEKQRRTEQRRKNSVLFIIGFHTFCMLAKAGCFAVRAGFPNKHELEYYCQRSNQFLIILNAAMNPILYAWRIDTLRKEMAKIMKGMLCFSSAVEIEPNA